jgi:hypothetical protein
MKTAPRKKFLFLLLSTIALISIFYGVGRLYYRLTDGFLISNISSANEYDPRWETRPLTEEEINTIQDVMKQPFHYLGKGCQSYVFASQDDKYVLKFFKYQRLRPQQWLEYLSFIPGVEQYRQNKIAIKRRKMEVFFNSWKIAFDKAPEETGIIYVHLNKTKQLNTQLTIFDKMGFQHVLNLDDFEFMIQKKASMLCSVIDDYMSSGRLAQAEVMLESLVARIVSEYKRGIADNDHALMQNTGVVEGVPVHIDVGQFVFQESVANPEFYTQELFTKTYKFRLWLKQKHPELAENFDAYLKNIIGDQFDTMKPLWRDKIEIFQLY